jgi:hypothetical protein
MPIANGLNQQAWRRRLLMSRGDIPGPKGALGYYPKHRPPPGYNFPPDFFGAGANTGPTLGSPGPGAGLSGTQLDPKKAAMAQAHQKYLMELQKRKRQHQAALQQRVFDAFLMQDSGSQF